MVVVKVESGFTFSKRRLWILCLIVRFTLNLLPIIQPWNGFQILSFWNWGCFDHLSLWAFSLFLAINLLLCNRSRLRRFALDWPLPWFANFGRLLFGTPCSLAQTLVLAVYGLARASKSLYVWCKCSSLLDTILLHNLCLLLSCLLLASRTLQLQMA